MPLGKTAVRNIGSVIRILQRGRDEANEEAGGITPVVPFTRFEVNQMITLLLDAREKPRTKTKRA